MIPNAQTAQAVLARLLEISIFSAVIFLVILGFRAVFQKKASPALRYGLWFLLLVRLTLPVTFATSVHLIVLPAQTPDPAVVSTVEAAAIPDTAESGTVQRFPTQFRSQETAREEGALSLEGAEIKRSQLSRWQILLLIWLFGATGILARDLWTAALLHARLKRYAAVPCAEIRREFTWMLRKMRISERVSLLQVQDITSPALTIGFRPKVLLPESLSWPEQGRDRTLALRHELTHLKRLDHLVMIWVGILRIIWWFLPVVWLMEKPLRMDMESACDAMVVKGMTADEKLYYASLLLELGKENGL